MSGIMKPILFNPSMVRAILDGRKTQTRRLIKGYIPDDAEWGYDVFTRAREKNEIACRGTFGEKGDEKYGEKFFKPPYLPGDNLYVRETWCNVNKPGLEPDYYYFADTLDSGCEDYIPSEWKWRPSIHMPKEAARIFLHVNNVRVERLHEMSEKDAKAEGARAVTNMSGIMHRLDFIKIWDGTIKPADRDRYGWDANPWVWVIEFEVVEVKDRKG